MKKSADDPYGDQEAPVPRSDIFGYRENATGDAVRPMESLAHVLASIPGAGSQYTEEELRIFRKKPVPKPALAVKPALPTQKKPLAPERFRYVWSPGRKPRDLPEDNFGNISDFRDYCEKYEGDYVLSQLAFFIENAPQLRKPPFTPLAGNQLVGHFEINLKANDGQILHRYFPLYAR